MSVYYKRLYIKISEPIKKLLIKSSPRWLVLLIDIFLVLNAFFISYLIRFNFNFSFSQYPVFLQMPVVALVALLSFLITGSYKGIVRHTGFKDAISVTKSALLMSIFLIFLVFIQRKTGFYPDFNIPISVLGLHFFVTVFFLISSRMIYKGFYNHLTFHFTKSKKILIHGAHSGVSVYEAILSNPEKKYEVVGFVDERPEFVNKLVHRVKVYHPKKITDRFVTHRQIDEVIISKPEATPIELLNIANKYLDLHLKVKTVPHINQWINDEIKINQIKELNIEDLLERSPIKIDNPVIQNSLTGKTVMVTGAAGSIGSEIALQVLHFNPAKLILIDQAESALYDVQQEFLRKQFKEEFVSIVADVRDKEKMQAYFEQYKPDIVYHAAAYKHVPLMENFPYEAIKINVLGSKIIMDLAVQYEVERFIMVSTDKAVNPTNVMGATKRAAEIYATCLQTKTQKTKFIITRFGNVLGSNGSVIQLFKKQIKEGGPLTVTHKKINRFFMTIPEACNLVLEAGTMGKGGEIFVFDMGEPVLIFNLAKKMIQLSGYRYPEDMDIKITGLRPGEKLYEEVLGQDENTIPTHHPKVKIAQVKQMDCDIVEQIVQKLQAVYELSDMEIVSLLKELIPEFKSNNSIYEKLDKNI